MLRVLQETFRGGSSSGRFDLGRVSGSPIVGAS
jgi:hypothetical protein